MKKGRLSINQKGFSVVEIVVTSAILALTVTSFVGALMYFNKSTTMAGAKTRAVFLAEEGLEVVRNIRDEDFSNLIDGTYGLAVSGGQWVFSGTEDLADIFTRQLTVSTIDASTKQIVSNINWDKGNVSLITYLTYWQEEVVVTETCGVYCQSIEYADGVCRTDATECTNNNETHEAGGNQYCTFDPAENICCCQAVPVFNSCSEYCASIGYSLGNCRQNDKQCGRNNETYESGGDNYCTGGASADTCCCAP
jgi:Tfp pilus assembly protein PilV